MNKCFRITIGGFKAEVDHRGMIVTCDEKIKALCFCNIKDIFEKYKTRTQFIKVTTIHYPLILGDDIYETMVLKNPALETLLQKFDCEIF